MAFEKVVPTWNAPGAEPPDTLKNEGFYPEYRPPAEYFNWFFSGVSACLEELQETLTYHVLPEGTDLNTLTEQGLYGHFSAPVASGYANNPLASQSTGIILEVWNSGGSVMQRLTGILVGSVYLRRYHDGGWSEWRKLALTTDNVASATKLQTARTITVTGAASGSFTFDGSENKTVELKSNDNKTIASGSDLNDFTAIGHYNCTSNNTVTTLSNCPTTNAFMLYVGYHGGTYQRLVEYRSSAPKIYFRNCVSGVWGDWHREYTTVDPPTEVASATKLTFTSIGSETDLDTVKTSGLYGQFTASFAQAIANSPLAEESTGIVLEVWTSGSSVMQRLTGILNGGVYLRRYHDGGWSEWRKLALTKEVDTKMNRTTNVNQADTNYTTLMARGTSLHAKETDPAVNGAICWMFG